MIISNNCSLISVQIIAQYAHNPFSPFWGYGSASDVGVWVVGGWLGVGRGQGVVVFVGWVCLDGHWFWNGLAVEKRVVAVAKWIVGICAVEAGQ